MEQFPATSADASSESDARGLIATYLELSKARLSALVVCSALVGFILASPAQIDIARLLWTLLGTALAAFGANAWNQCLEIDRDARMRRTCGRPLPSGRISRRAGLAFAVSSGLLGPIVLAIMVGATPGFLALITLVIYVGLYTPMKVRSPFNTLVGAVVGALPPLIGWTAVDVDGVLQAPAWILAGVLFCWQIPHFLALAWLYREDYARGGFRMLPAVDESGAVTSSASVLYSLALLPLALGLSLVGVTGRGYAVAGVVLGAGLLVLALRFQRTRRDVDARRLFIASVVYLPLLLTFMVVDRVPRSPAEPPAGRVLFVPADGAADAWEAARAPN